MTKDALTQRIEELKKAEQDLLAKLNSVSGARRENESWLKLWEQDECTNKIPKGAPEGQT
jgi:hypothetical protein